MTQFSDMFLRDLARCYSEVGLPVRYNDYQTNGVLLHEPTDALQLGGKQVAVAETTLTLTVLYGSLGTIQNNDQLIVDGEFYTITKFIQLGASNEQKLWIMAVR